MPAQPKARASSADRVRASKLRKRRASGKALSSEAAAWLAKYETAHTIARAKSEAAPDRATVGGGPAVVVRPVSHETAPVTERIDAATNTWRPVGTAAQPPKEGEAPSEASPADARAAAGTPLVDDAKQAAPVVDTAAADQFATLVTFIVRAGLRAGAEMLEEADAPPEVRALFASPQATAGALETVASAAHRVAIKHGFTSVPLGDEAIVLGAVGASAVLVVRQLKRKRLPTKPTPAAESKPGEVKGHTDIVPASEIDSLWSEP